jgi:hypothetical protein
VVHSRAAPSSVAKTLRKVDFISPKVYAVLGPELAQALVTPEGLRHRDVAHLTVVGVDFDQGLDVPVLLQFPQSLDEVVHHFFGHKTTSLVEKIPFASSSESRQDNEPQDASQSAAILILPNARDDRI